MESGKNVAFILTMFQSYQWLHVKNQILEKSKIDSQELFNNEEDIINFKWHIDFEIIINTVHFAEVFASNLLALKKLEVGFHKYLLEYNIPDIIDFYQNAKYFDNEYICKLMGYPEITYCDEEFKNMLIKSCDRVKKGIMEIGEFYLANRELYNAYKHGFRIAILEMGSEYGERKPVVMRPSSSNELNQVSFSLIQDSDALEKSNIMYNILTGVYETFKQKVIENKDSFEIKLWE